MISGRDNTSMTIVDCSFRELRTSKTWCFLYFCLVKIKMIMDTFGLVDFFNARRIMLMLSVNTGGREDWDDEIDDNLWDLLFEVRKQY